MIFKFVFMGFLCVKVCISALVCISYAFLWIFVCVFSYPGLFTCILSYFSLLIFSILFYINKRKRGTIIRIVSGKYIFNKINK